MTTLSSRFFKAFIMAVLILLSYSAVPAQDVMSAPAGDGVIIQIKGVMIENLRGTFNATFQNTPVGDIVRIFAAQTGLNMLVSPKVNATVTANFKDAPIRSAFLAILSANNLYYLEQEGIIKVLTQPEYKNELLRGFVESRSYDASIIDIKNLAIILKPILSPGVGNFVIDAQSSKVIVTDVKDNFERIEKLFADLASLPKMVEIETRIVQVNLDNSSQFGINWKFLNVFNTLDVGFVTTASNLGQGLTVRGFVSNQSVNGEALINILATKYNASLLSKPRILVLNRNQAIIHIGSKEPYVKSVIQTGSTGQTTSQVDFIDVGIKLDVTPVISRGNEVKIDIKAELSSSEIITIGNNEKAPRINTTEAQCSAIVRDGDTVIIGGLFKQQKSKNKTGIPILMDIPFLDYFFSYTEDVVTKSEIVIFMTPRVLENGAGNVNYGGGTPEALEAAGFTNR